jgi:hypothetical protein
MLVARPGRCLIVKSVQIRMRSIGFLPTDEICASQSETGDADSWEAW